MARRHRWLLVLATVSLLVVGVSWGVVSSQSAGVPEMAGAREIAGGGGEPYPEVGMPLADLGLEDGSYAFDVRSDSGGGLWVLTALDAMHVDGRGRIDWRASPPGRGEATGHLAPGPGDSLVCVSPSSSLDYADLRSSEDDQFLDLPFLVASAAFQDDGTLLLSARGEARIAAMAPDGSLRPLAVPASSGEDAPVRLDDNVRATVLALPEGRVVFAIDTVDGGGEDGEVHVIEGGQSRQVEVESPRPIRRIFPGPDGDTVLAQDARGILQLNVETGAMRLLVDLYAVDPDLIPAASQDGEWYWGDVSAAVDGPDLVFTADGRLWRLEDAFS